MEDNNSTEDQVLVCIVCRQSFVFTIGEQEFYIAHKFMPPRRCKTCREARKHSK